jgi:hypothetical protein
MDIIDDVAPPVFIPLSPGGAFLFACRPVNEDLREEICADEERENDCEAGDEARN